MQTLMKKIKSAAGSLDKPALKNISPGVLFCWGGIGAFSGAVVFSLLAVWQHSLIGGALEPRGFIVPVLFGGVTGALIGIHHYHRRCESRRRRAIIAQLRGKEKELRFQATLLDQIQDKITATDLEGNITYVNQAESRFFGKSRRELIGRCVKNYGDDPERGATQKEIIEKTLREGQWRGEVVNFNEEGEEIILDCRTTLLRDDDGSPAGMVSRTWKMW